MPSDPLIQLLLVMVLATLLGAIIGWNLRAQSHEDALRRLHAQQEREKRELQTLIDEQQQLSTRVADQHQQELEQYKEQARKACSERDALREHAELQIRKIKRLQGDLQTAGGRDASRQPTAQVRRSDQPAMRDAGVGEASLAMPVLSRRREGGGEESLPGNPTAAAAASASVSTVGGKPSLAARDDNDFLSTIDPIPLPGDDDFPSLAESELPALFDEDELGLTRDFSDQSRQIAAALAEADNDASSDV